MRSGHETPFSVILLPMMVLCMVMVCLPDRSDAVVKPLASGRLPNGATVEVLGIRRTSDQMLLAVWQYRNPNTDKSVYLFSTDDARNLMSKIYVVDVKSMTRLGVATVRREKASDKKEYIAAEVPSVSLEPGQSLSAWAKFPAPADDATTIDFYHPATGPMEELPIEPAPSTQPAIQGTSAGHNPQASQTLDSGLRLEVLGLRRSSDGSVTARWQYVNPTDKSIYVFGSSAARDYPQKIYVIDPDAQMKYPPAVAATVEWSSLDAGNTAELWAKFLLPATAKRLTLYLPGVLPVEDLVIGERK